MGEKNLLDNPPEKVLAMYRAVMKLVYAGANVNHIKVSEITECAGIGKGTAYEYFSSKEEIITNAFAFDIRNKRRELAEIVDGQGSFAEKMERVLDYAEEKFCESQTFDMLVRVGIGSCEISEALRVEYEKMRGDISCGQLEEIMERLVRQGLREGVIKEKNPTFWRMAFGAQVVAYVSQRRAGNQGKKTDVTKEQTKKFVYDSLVKSLN